MTNAGQPQLGSGSRTRLTVQAMLRKFILGLAFWVALGFWVSANIGLAHAQGGPGGSIEIVKTVVGKGAIFNFTTSGTGLSNFTLTPGNNASAATAFTNLTPGSYTVSEMFMGYNLTGLSCTGDTDGGNVINLATREVTIDLDADEHQTCTFTNTDETPFDPEYHLHKEAVVYCDSVIFTYKILNWAQSLSLDGNFLDVLPAGLQFDPASITITGDLSGSPTTVFSPPDTLTINGISVNPITGPLPGVVTITVTAQITGTFTSATQLSNQASFKDQ